MEKVDVTFLALTFWAQTQNSSVIRQDNETITVTFTDIHLCSVRLHFTAAAASRSQRRAVSYSPSGKCFTSACTRWLASFGSSVSSLPSLTTARRRTFL